MATEGATTIAGLDVAEPKSGGGVGDGDDHLRQEKSVLKNVFPGELGEGFAEPIVCFESDLNNLTGTTGNIQTQIDVNKALSEQNESNIADDATLTAGKVNKAGDTMTGNLDIGGSASPQVNLIPTAGGGFPAYGLMDTNSTPRGIFYYQSTSGAVNIRRDDVGGAIQTLVILESDGNVKATQGASVTPVPTSVAHLTNKDYVDAVKAGGLDDDAITFARTIDSVPVTGNIAIDSTPIILEAGVWNITHAFTDRPVLIHGDANGSQVLLFSIGDAAGGSGQFIADGTTVTATSSGAPMSFDYTRIFS